MQSIRNTLTGFRKVKVYSATTRWNHSILHIFIYKQLMGNADPSLGKSVS